VCVNKCPDDHFAFVLFNDFSDQLRDRMICKLGVSVNSMEDARNKIASNQCAGYYLKSRSGESAVTTFSVRIFHKLL
jgi:hypothetical protein